MDTNHREEAYRKIAAGLQMQAEGYAALALLPQFETRREVGPEDEPLTIPGACLLLNCDRSTVYRLMRQHPEIKRKVGSRLRVEKHALLRTTRKP